MRAGAALAVLVATGSPAAAQLGGTASGTASATAAPATPSAAASVVELLRDGFDIKTAFADPSGGAYIILQRSTSAFLCHSAPRQTCEKMN